VTPSTASGGSCTATTKAQIPTWDPATGWSGTARVCGTGSSQYYRGGCAQGEICVPAPPSTFGGKVCLQQSGQLSCPATGYTVAHAYYNGASDTRDCDSANTCHCDDPTGTICTSAVTLYSRFCASTNPVTLGSGCQQLANFSVPYVSATVTATGGSCGWTGSVSAIGGITPTGIQTVCCEP
jgi:hypothetical protein